MCTVPNIFYSAKHHNQHRADDGNINGCCSFLEEYRKTANSPFDLQSLLQVQPTFAKTCLLFSKSPCHLIQAMGKVTRKGESHCQDCEVRLLWPISMLSRCSIHMDNPSRALISDIQQRSLLSHGWVCHCFSRNFSLVLCYRNVIHTWSWFSFVGFLYSSPF